MEDQDAWELYPQHRWIFNKLEVAQRLGYDCGPACIPVSRSGKYIIRPIYNLYGMGVGAHFLNIDISQAKEMNNHALIPPGYFWCEFFEGTHYSIDFKRTNAPPKSKFCWEPFSTMIGEKDENQLTKFASWSKIENISLTPPDICNNLDGVETINVEFIGDKPIEIHLRSGNDVMYDLPMGTKLIPVWDSDEGLNVCYRETIDIPNENTSCRYDASGYLKYYRVGYKIYKEKHNG